MVLDEPVVANPSFSEEFAALYDNPILFDDPGSPRDCLPIGIRFISHLLMTVR